MKEAILQLDCSQNVNIENAAKFFNVWAALNIELLKIALKKVQCQEAQNLDAVKEIVTNVTKTSLNVTELWNASKKIS